MQRRSVQNQSDMKANNSKLVLNLIRDNQDSLISRADIAKITKMSATSITRITDFLMASGLVEQSEAVINGGVGRNAIHLQVVADALLTLGVSIDSDYIDICILDFEDSFTGQRRIKLGSGNYTAAEVLDIAYQGFKELCRESGGREEMIKAVGISCIGNIEPHTGMVFFAPQFQWTDVEMGKMAKERFHCPVYVDNDMKSSLVGLGRRHKEIRYEDVTYLSIGTGVGAAVMYGGNLVRGSNNAAGEVGHIILESSGRPCDCGRTGCVQTYLTTNSLVEQCQEAGREIQDVSQIYEAFWAGTEWAEKFIDSQANHLAMLIRNLVYMYNTRYILVGGAILSDFPDLFSITVDKVAGLLHENLRADLNIERVEERDNSRAGAAFMAQEAHLEYLLVDKGPSR